MYNGRVNIVTLFLEAIFGFLIGVVGGFIIYYWHEPAWSGIGGALVASGLSLIASAFFSYRHQLFFTDVVSLFGADFGSIEEPPENANKYRYYYHQTRVNGKLVWRETECDWHSVSGGKFLKTIVKIQGPGESRHAYESILFFLKGRAVMIFTSRDKTSAEVASISTLHQAVSVGDFVGYNDHMTWDPGDEALDPCYLSLEKRNITNSAGLQELEGHWRHRMSSFNIRIPPKHPNDN